MRRRCRNFLLLAQIDRHFGRHDISKEIVHALIERRMPIFAENRNILADQTYTALNSCMPVLAPNRSGRAMENYEQYALDA